MGQNTSSAVMQQRSEPHDSLDDFPTPPWATRALCELLAMHHTDIGAMTVWEPACNRGHMARPLAEYFGSVIASDIHDYGYAEHVDTRDFLFPHDWLGIDWIITNPPFRLAEQFIQRGLEIAYEGVAVLVRSSFIESVGRYERLFKDNAPTIVAQFVERVPMVRGRYDPKASTATSYCWLIWIKGHDRLPTHWIAPCRKRLERPTDAATGQEAA